MLTDPHTLHRPQTSSENPINRRQNQPKIDTTVNFAPWEVEDAVDYTSSSTLTLLGFKTASARPYTAVIKASSFANSPDQTDGDTRTATIENMKKETKKVFRKQVTIAERKDYQRPSSFRPSVTIRVPTDSETSPPSSPKYFKASSNHASHREEVQNKPVAKPREPHRRNQWAAGYYSKPRHTSEQVEGVARARSQELDPMFNVASFGMQINRILDNTKSFTGKDGTGNMKVLDAQNGVEGLEPIISTGASFMLVQDEAETNRKKGKNLSISCRTSPKGVNNGEFHFLKGIRGQIQSPVNVDSKILTVENEASESMKSPVDDGRDETKGRASKLGKEGITFRLSSKTGKIHAKGTSNKPKNLTSLMQIKQIGREGDKRDESAWETEVQFSSYASQTLRPGTAKHSSSAVKWFGRSSRVDEEGSGTGNVPSMLECYKKNKKKYQFRASYVNSPKQAQPEDTFKISQIPLLGNLMKMLDSKVKSEITINARRDKTRKLGLSLSPPPPERTGQQISISNIKIGESVLYDKDTSQNNLKGKLEASLRQKMTSFSGVISKKSDIFEEKPTSTHEIFKVANERASRATLTGYSPKKPKRPATGLQLFRSWK